MISGMAVTKPGLHKHTGAWAIAYGLVKPVVVVDPQTPIGPGYNALVAHEVAHCMAHHKLKQVICLMVPVLGWLLYPLLAARHEAMADGFAYDMFGEREFYAFLAMHKHPTSLWGRWKYGRDEADRAERAREVVRWAKKGDRSE